MATIAVKHYNSGMQGAPQLANAWGDMTALLDAVLVDGFNLRTIDTLTFVDGIDGRNAPGREALQSFRGVACHGKPRVPPIA